MKVYDSRLGRLGNALFRYFASTLFCIIYNAERIYDPTQSRQFFNDSMFIQWSNFVLEYKIPQIIDTNYEFYGFYQHDKIFIKYKNELIKWMKEHPNDIVYTDGNDPILNIYNYNYPVQSFKIGDIINNPNKSNNKIYKTVIHLRLEDFINNSAVIHPDCIVNIMKSINSDEYTIVLNKPKNEIEINYVNYLKSKFNIILQTGTVIEDFHVMCQAETLVCSSSTLSWIASFLSDTVKTVYFPNKTREPHESFNKPIENTHYYDIKLCSKEELETFFNKVYLNTSDKKDNLVISDKQNLYFDIIIPLGPNDLNKIDIMIDNTKKYIIGYNKIYVVTNKKQFDKLEKYKDIILIDEDIFIDFNFNYINSLKNNTDKSRSGWYFQQLIKLYAGFYITNLLPNYLVIDSDTNFLKPTTFFKNDLPLYNFGIENHKPYFTHMQNLHPSLYKKSNVSGICHHMIFQKSIIIQLFYLIETYHNKKFYEIFLENVSNNEWSGSGASEYELYFNYLHLYHNNKFKIRELKWTNASRLNNNNAHDYISCHWYL
jgi:hypothetical protein